MNALASIVIGIVLVVSPSVPATGALSAGSAGAGPQVASAPAATPLECLFWHWADPERYRKYCL